MICLLDRHAGPLVEERLLPAEESGSAAVGVLDEVATLTAVTSTTFSASTSSCLRIPGCASGRHASGEPHQGADWSIAGDQMIADIVAVGGSLGGEDFHKS